MIQEIHDLSGLTLRSVAFPSPIPGLVIRLLTAGEVFSRTACVPSCGLASPLPWRILQNNGAVPHPRVKLPVLGVQAFIGASYDEPTN
jgi:hypothetical protein